MCLVLAGCQTPGGLMARGNEAYRRHDRATARKLYSEALAFPESRGAASYNLGVVAFEEGDFAGAVPFLRQAVSDDPGFAGARLYLAWCAKRMGDSQEHRAQLRKAVLLEPSLERTSGL
jgi:tetratricopeptide (TPR) repeat protein